MEHIQRRAGRNSPINKFDDYALYRKITLLNTIGKRLTEKEARDEYEVEKRGAATLFGLQYVSKWELFYEFILFTLSVIKINAQLVDFFTFYVDLSTDPRKELDLYLELLLFSKLKNLNFNINFIVEEGDRGKTAVMAVLYFKDSHWVRVDCEWFRCFLSKCFPNLKRIDALINHISTLDMSHSISADKVQFKRWMNIMPFTNGLFDFCCVDNFLTAGVPKNDDASSTTGSIATAGDTGISTFAQSVLQHYDSVADFVHKLAYEHNVCTLTVDECQTYQSFSVFRNYIHTDSVLTPIGRAFNIHDYLATFSSTKLLSLDNFARYSEEFCTYIRCLFGNNARDGAMGTFQYIRMLIVFMILAQGMLRNKIFQLCLNFIGCGSNGKSLFMNRLVKLFGDKFAFIKSRSFFNDDETLQQGVDLDESCIVYDVEADHVFLSNFKTFVTDDVATLRRRLYHGLERNKANLSSVVLCSNVPVKYFSRTLEISQYDAAFDRRIMIVPFYNILGKKPSGNSRMAQMYKAYQAHVNQKQVTSRRAGTRAVEKFSNFRESEEEYESLFKSKGYDIKNVSAQIDRGLLFYMLDIMHVFNLANLNASNHDYIVSSPANKRILGTANYVFLRLLLETYVCYDEISNDMAEIASLPAVDLGAFFMNAQLPKGARISMPDICNNLETCFGIYIEKTDSSALDELAELALPSDDKQPAVDFMVGKYRALGLKKKNQLSAREEELFSNPNRLYEISGSQDLEFSLTDEIPIAHRFDFGREIKTTFYETVQALVTGDTVKPLQKPLVANEYTNKTLNDLLHAIS